MSQKMHVTQILYVERNEIYTAEVKVAAAVS